MQAVTISSCRYSEWPHTNTAPDDWLADRLALEYLMAINGKRSFCLHIKSSIVVCRMWTRIRTALQDMWQAVIHPGQTTFDCSRSTSINLFIIPNSMKIPMRCSLLYWRHDSSWQAAITRNARPDSPTWVTYYPAGQWPCQEHSQWPKVLIQEAGRPARPYSQQQQQCQLGSTLRKSTYRPIGPLSSLSAMIKGWIRSCSTRWL